jgi:hypothetical protein
MRVFRKNAILGLGVGLDPGPLTLKACALPMRHSTSTLKSKLNILTLELEVIVLKSIPSENAEFGKKTN